MQGFNATEQTPLPGSVLAGGMRGSALVTVDPGTDYVLVIIADADNSGPLSVNYTTRAYVAGAAGESPCRCCCMSPFRKACRACSAPADVGVASQCLSPCPSAAVSRLSHGAHTLFFLRQGCPGCSRALATNISQPVQQPGRPDTVAAQSVPATPQPVPV